MWTGKGSATDWCCCWLSPAVLSLVREEPVLRQRLGATVSGVGLAIWVATDWIGRLETAGR